MSLSTIILSMVLLGGASTIYGAIVASFVLTVFSEAMADFGPWRPMITAVAIIAVMLAYPSGLAGLLRAAWSLGSRQLSKAPSGRAAQRSPQ
jgi:branched-chain amino acid transport system permease protein